VFQTDDCYNIMFYVASKAGSQAHYKTRIALVRTYSGLSVCSLHRVGWRR